MTPDRFRRIVLGLQDATENAHHGHPDFRVRGRVFATLGYPDRSWGMVKLTPDQQRTCVREHPDAFVAVKGKWGEQGCTNVRLDSIDDEILGHALTLAWQHAVAEGRAPARKRGIPSRPNKPRNTASMRRQTKR
jgi:YjbR